MSVRRTLRHLKTLVRGLWNIIRNWRTLWHLHTDIQENEQLDELQTLREQAENCPECDPGLCQYHRDRFEAVKQDIREQDWSGDRL